MSLADVADLLACPTCAARDLPDAALVLDGTTLRCSRGHAYDVARQGHVNLLGRSVPRNADGSEMVAARERFLGGGAYDAVADALATAALGTSCPAPVVLDVGAGPGWYLDRVLARLAGAGRTGRGIALDVSPSAARRVLALGGHAVVVSPLPEHLATLRAAWGLLDVEPGKQERLSATFAEHLAPVDEVDVRRRVTVGRAGLDDLVAMGPNAFHPHEQHRTAVLDAIEVAVRVSTWGRPGTGPG